MPTPNDSKPRIPSDALVGIYALIDTWPELAEALGQPKRLVIVVDSNVILTDLIWMEKNRRKPTARTRLVELLASGTVIAFAPKELDEEVMEHLPRRAGEVGIAPEVLVLRWEQIRQHIHRAPGVSGSRPITVPDDDDVPFYQLTLAVGARGIYTQDSHHREMGTPIIETEALEILLRYSRDTAIECTIRLGASILLVAALSVVLAALEALAVAVRFLADNPEIAAVIALGILLLLSNPRSRARISTLIQSVMSVARDKWASVVPVLSELARASVESGSRSRLAWTEAELGLPPARPIRAVDYAFAVMVRAGHPLPMTSLLKGMLAIGYVSRSDHPWVHLARRLRRDPRFQQLDDGQWRVLITDWSKP